MIKGVEYVTIASDISMAQREDVGTWAVYIRGDFGTIKQSGEFRDFVRSSAMLELRALCNAIHIANKYTDLSKSVLIIYSEVSHLFKFKYKKDYNGVLTSEPIKSSKERYEFFQQYMQPALNLAQSYDLRVVKAHSREGSKPGAPAKYFMNRWCDKESRRLMKELRRKKK